MSNPSKPFTGKSLNTLIATLVLLFAHSIGAQANELAADVLLKQTAEKMINTLNNERNNLKGNPDRVRELVEQELLPHIDIITASRWVLGKHWRTAEKEQKIKFIRQFRSLLLRFYSNALAEYLDSKDSKPLDISTITFLPLRMEANEKDVVVRSIIKQDNGQTVPVNYSMHLTSKGWKVYDVAVEGISVISTYRTSFATEIKQHGIDSLIASLSDKNNKFIDQAPKPRKVSAVK